MMAEKQIKIVMLANIVIRVAFMVCVTVAAISFDKPAMCWWYLLSIFMGYEIRKAADEDEEE